MQYPRMEVPMSTNPEPAMPPCGVAHAVSPLASCGEPRSRHERGVRSEIGNLAKLPGAAVTKAKKLGEAKPMLRSSNDQSSKH